MSIEQNAKPMKSPPVALAVLERRESVRVENTDGSATLFDGEGEAEAASATKKDASAGEPGARRRHGGRAAGEEQGMGRDHEDDDAESETEEEQLVRRGQRLQKQFQQTAVQLKEHFTQGSRFELAKEQMAAWRKDVKQFSNHIKAQLAYCRSLREGKSMASLLHQSPEMEATRRAHRFVTQVKLDIRALHGFLQSQRAAKEAEAHATAQSDKAFLHSLEDQMPDPCREEAEAAALEGRLGLFKLFDERTEEQPSESQGKKKPRQPPRQPPSNKERESNNAGGPFRHAQRHLVGIPEEELFDVVAEQHRLLAQVLEVMLDGKTALDSSLGLKTHQDQFASNLGANKSRQRGLDMASDLTTNVVNVADSMAHLIGVAQTLGYVRDGVDMVEELHRLRSENKALTAHVALHDSSFLTSLTPPNQSSPSASASASALPAAHLRPAAAPSLAALPPGGGGGSPTSGELLRMDEARQRLGRVDAELREVQRRNASLLLRNGSLGDELNKARDDHRSAQARHAAERAYLRPRVATLEQLVRASAASFDSMALDVELITNMYLHSSGELGKRTLALDAAQLEQRQVSARVRSLITVLREEKAEGARKERVIATLMGTRHEMSKTVKAAQANATRSADQLSGVRAAQQERDASIEALGVEHKRAAEALARAEAGQLDIREQLGKEQRRRKVAAAKHASKVKAMEAQVESMKMAGMDHETREAYDEMKMRLKHAILAYQKLEKQLTAATASDEP